MHSLLQILADAPVMDTALSISPLDPRQRRIKQEDCRELHVSHCAADMDYQVGWLQDCHAAHVLIPYSALSRDTCIASYLKLNAVQHIDNQLQHTGIKSMYLFTQSSIASY